MHIIFKFGMVNFIMALIACLTFLLPLRERWSPKKFVLESAAITISAVIFYYVLASGENSRYTDWYWSIRPILLYIVIFILVTGTTDLGKKELIYYSIWIYLIREFEFDFSQIIMNFLGNNLTNNYWGIVLCYALTDVLIYWAIARNLPDEGRITVDQGQLYTTILLAVFITVLKPYAVVAKMNDQVYAIFVVIQMTLNFLVMLLLYQLYLAKRNAGVQQELRMQKRLWLEHEKQMEKAKRDAELINIKYHDLKHYVEAIRNEENNGKRIDMLDDIDRVLNSFVSQIHTENEILDTVLTQKAMICEKNHIEIACVADGKLLNKINSVDLYVIFGNALDNAIEAVTRLHEREKKIITVAVFQVHNMVKIQIENLCETPLEYNDSFPVTIKSDKENHGFGLKSIRNSVEKYSGYVTTECEDGIFTLHILIPLITSYEEKTTN